MTPRQVAHCYFCERDDKGQVAVEPPAGRQPGGKAGYLAHLYRIGVTDRAKQEDLYREHRRRSDSGDG